MGNTKEGKKQSALKRKYNMEIKKLKDVPQYTETVIDWITAEFGDENSGKFFQSIIEHSKNEEELPLTFVAIEDGTLVGTAGIWRADLLSRQDLFPWFSALVVHPEYRNQGIGKQMQAHLIAYCKEKGMKELYLYAEFKGYYEKMGWQPFGDGYEFTGNKVHIYRQEL